MHNLPSRFFFSFCFIQTLPVHIPVSSTVRPSPPVLLAGHPCPLTDHHGQVLIMAPGLAMHRRGICVLVALIACAFDSSNVGPRGATACTTIAIGRNASKDGSTMCTHNADVSTILQQRTTGCMVSKAPSVWWPCYFDWSIDCLIDLVSLLSADYYQ